MNILIVDANVGTLALLKQVVSSGFPNCSVFVATTGREAVQQVASGAGCSDSSLVIIVSRAAAQLRRACAPEAGCEAP
jgi:CheY-like chemotaxis protein